jgi:hypothetical protein
MHERIKISRMHTIKKGKKSMTTTNNMRQQALASTTATNNTRTAIKILRSNTSKRRECRVVARSHQLRSNLTFTLERKSEKMLQCLHQGNDACMLSSRGTANEGRTYGFHHVAQVRVPNQNRCRMHFPKKLMLSRWPHTPMNGIWSDFIHGICTWKQNSRSKT